MVKGVAKAGLHLRVMMNYPAPARVTLLDKQPFAGCIYWSGVRVVEGGGLENR